MSGKVRQGKRARERSFVDSINESMLDNLLDCHYFLSPNEYLADGFGILAYLTRKSVGEFNFSNVFAIYIQHKLEKRKIDIKQLLEQERMNLPKNKASIEKCLVLNRLISYIEEKREHVATILTRIQSDMSSQFVDNNESQIINYPQDFRQREQDFIKRQNAQNMRRLFYLNYFEAQQPPSLIYLQNRTTEQLNYLIDYKMRCDSTTRNNDIKELENIFITSFIINDHPRHGLSPVAIYEREMSRTYSIKISVKIVSLLQDFMEMHPNVIELDNIDISLSPSSVDYKFDETLKLNWKICKLNPGPGLPSKKVRYAELSEISITLNNDTDSCVHLSQYLHTFKFLIKLRLNLPQFNLSKTYQIPLETFTFAIYSHYDQLPHALTRILMDDIQRLKLTPTTVDVKTLLNFILRYFIHRTGVQPNEDLMDYLNKQLTKVHEEKKSFTKLEDIFMNFLVPFVNQVEFMVKHPILSMFFAENLSLSICDSQKVEEIMKQSADENSSIICLRLNSMKFDSKSDKLTSITSISKKKEACFVRIDIYNEKSKKFENLTFNSMMLIEELSSFIHTARNVKTNRIRILSKLCLPSHTKNYKSFSEFLKYYDDFTKEIFKTDEKYRPITNLTDDIELDYGNDLYNFNDELFDIPIDDSSFPNETILNQENINQPTTVIGATSLSVSNSFKLEQFSKQEIIEYVRSQPDILCELFRQLGFSNSQQFSSQLIQSTPQNENFLNNTQRVYIPSDYSTLQPPNVISTQMRTNQFHLFE